MSFSRAVGNLELLPEALVTPFSECKFKDHGFKRPRQQEESSGIRHPAHPGG
ncbi:hypothetical protein [Luteolibacter yonseiensis]|uniref:hypothetical protein n=1 Tax=Luteolibacter yonseiensis TaxID=1144680 RepID=UPI001F47713F|nr:hypothetical protein [Luteolibacter yonseiensis]